MNTKDRVRGSLIGGAAGDALGYVVEFSRESTIFRQYGEKGLRRYRISPTIHKAIISDDTQMTLFTAAAMIVYDELKKAGLSAPLREYANIAYQDWLITQEMTYEEASTKVIKDSPDYPDGFISVVIKDVPELFQRRTPVVTSLNALQTRRDQRVNHEHVDSFIASKVNNSHDCGAITRIAPLGMVKKTDDIASVAIEAAECAAITHSHPLGYMSASAFAEIIYRILYNDEALSLKEIVENSMADVADIFRDEADIDKLMPKRCSRSRSIALSSIRMIFPSASSPLSISTATATPPPRSPAISSARTSVMTRSIISGKSSWRLLM